MPLPEIPMLTEKEKRLLDRVKVNAPAMMLREGMLDKFLAWGLHPEVGLDARALDQVSRTEMSRMAKAILDAGLRPTVHGPFIDLAPGAIDPMVLDVTRRRFDHALDLAALFQPEHMVFHANYERLRQGFFTERWLEISLETWRSLARRARELGVRLVLENTYETTPDEMAPLLAELAAEGIGFCFDTGHASAFGRADLLEWFDVLQPHLAAMHLHDNDGGWDDHLAIGQGRIDFKSLFERMVSRGVRPRVVTLEPHEEHQVWQSLKALAEIWPWPLDVV